MITALPRLDQLWSMEFLLLTFPILRGYTVIICWAMYYIVSCKCHSISHTPHRILHLLTACSRVCQNEGTLDEGTCVCSCVGGFSGANCESECNVKKLMCIRFIIIIVNLGSILYFTYICTCNPPKCCKQVFNCNIYITQNDDPLILCHFITLSIDLSKWRNTQWNHL